jgi:hypothetical protein
MPRLMTRRLVENAASIDIRELARRHGKAMLEAGRVGLVIDGAQHRPLVTRAPMPFGGARVFWVCPKCGCRALLLYVRRSALMCRRCARLKHWSQSISSCQRRVRRICRLRDRLGAPAGQGLLAPLPLRPRGMHKATYARLCGEIEARERRHRMSTMSRRALRWLAGQ